MDRHSSKQILLVTAVAILTPLSKALADDKDYFSLSLEELLNVEVKVAGKRKQKLTDIKQTSYHINSVEIKQNAYRSIAEALNSLPGFSMQTNWYLDRLVIRGQTLTSDKLLLLIDGQSMTMVSDNYNIFNGASPVAMHEIESIEVIMGPNSTLYGSGAFVGVININTKGKEQDSEIAFHVSNLNEHSGSVFLTQQFDEIDVRLHANLVNNGGHDLDLTFPDGAAPSYTTNEPTVDGYNTIKAQRISFGLSTESIDANIRLSDSEIGWPTGIFATDINDSRNQYKIEKRSAQLTHKLAFSPTWQLSNRVYYNRSVGKWQGIYEGELWLPPEGEIYAGDSIGFEVKSLWQPDSSMSLVGGFEFTQNNDVQSVDYIDTFDNASIFALIDWEASNKLYVEAGARVEQYSYRDSPEIMPQINLSYQFSDAHMIGLNTSKGFIAPSTWIRQAGHSIGKKNINPELFTTMEAKYRYSKDNWYNQITLFSNSQYDNIEIEYQDNQVARVINSSDEEQYTGIEWSGKTQLSEHWLSKFSVSYVDATKTSDAQPDSIVGYSHWLMGFTVQYQTEQQSIILQHKFTQELVGYDEIEGHHKIDLTWTQKELFGADVTLKLDNILNEEINTFDSSNIVDSIPAKGRHIKLSASYQF